MAKLKKVKDDNAEYGCTLYVDGGCRPGYAFDDPKARYGGWGFHGYTYKIGNKPPKKRTKKDIPTVDGYLDGNKVDHNKQVMPASYIDGWGSTNNRADSAKSELAGFSNAVDFVLKQNYKQVHFLLDNQYVIDGLNGGYEKWSGLDWKNPNGGTYANSEIWNEIMGKYQPSKEYTKYTVQWVNGHSGNLGNDRADYLATKGVYKGRNGELEHSDVVESPVPNYRNPKPEINRLFSKGRWYFNTDIEPEISNDGRYVYHCGHHGTDDSLIGKAISDSVTYVVYTKEKQEVLEAVRQQHIRLIPNPYNELCMCHLDKLLLPRIYSEIENDGVSCLSIAPRRLKYCGLTTIDENIITKVIRPSGLTFRLIDTQNYMQTVLDTYLDGKATTTDITSLIYTNKLVMKKKKEVTVVEMSIPQGTKCIKPTVKLKSGDEHKCTLTFGIDIPSREMLSALAPRNPKVNVITWSLSPSAFRYSVVIECDDDVMMWTGKDSSMQLVYK